MQKYKSNITTTSGAAVRGVPVHVLAEDGSPASIFLDRDGMVPAPNPLTTGADGTFYFYAANGRYSLRTTVDGVTITDADVVLLMDVEEIAFAGPIADAVQAAESAAGRAEAAVAGSGITELVSTAQNAVVDANAALISANAAATSADLALANAVAAKDAADLSASAANTAAANAALAADSASLNYKTAIRAFETYAAANAAVGSLADGSIIEVSQDETRVGARTRYKVQAGALVFVVNLDQTKLDLAAATGASLVGGGDQVVASIAALRLLLKTSASKNALTTGYYTAGDGGGGARYYCDIADTTSSDNGCTVIVAADGGRWKMVFTGALSVHQAGAKGDGATNDRAAIQAAMNAVSASGGGTINFSAGKTYIVIPTANTSFILQNATGIRLQGAPGATIKVAAAAGGYLGILGVDGGNPAVFNMTVDGLTFDHNTANNPLTTLADIQTYPRATLTLWQGANVRFTNNTVKNESSMAALDLNGELVSDLFIKNNKFLNCGMTSNAIDHDHSTIYCMADNVQIANNVFITDWANKSCRTAIETHGSRYNVSGNMVLGYICGVIITGIHSTNSTQQTVIGNSITTRAQGIVVWSQTFAAITTGYGIEGVLIADNLINIKQGSYYTGSDVVMGIGIYPIISLGVKELNILNNSIEFEQEGVIPAGYTGNARSLGIGWNLITSARPLVNCSIKGNRVFNGTVSGISIVGGDLYNVEVSGNTLVNCAQSFDATLNAYKYPLALVPNSSTITFNVANNRVTDNFATTRARAAMLIASVTAGGKCEIVGNDINIEGVTTSAYLTSHTISGVNMVPLIKDTANLALLPAAGSCAEGSTFAGKGDSRTYRYIGGKWLARRWSDVIPVAAGNQGDYAENRNKAVGQPKGWWCTGGATWVSDGNL